MLQTSQSAAQRHLEPVGVAGITAAEISSCNHFQIEPVIRDKSQFYFPDPSSFLLLLARRCVASLLTCAPYQGECVLRQLLLAASQAVVFSRLSASLGSSEGKPAYRVRRLGKHMRLASVLLVALLAPGSALAQSLEYCLYDNYGNKQLCYISATACQSAAERRNGAQCYAEQKQNPYPSSDNFTPRYGNQGLQYCLYNDYGVKQLCYFSASSCQSAADRQRGAQCYAEPQR